MAEDYTSKSPIKRDAFLYFDPKGDGENFAQCGTCNMFMSKEKRCMILEKDLEVTEKDSCGVYVYGKPMEHHTMTAKEAGFVRDVGVRCINCEYYDPGDSDCELFEKINEECPDDFRLDTKVDPQGCCNAFIASKPSLKNLRKKGAAMAKDYEKEGYE